MIDDEFLTTLPDTLPAMAAIAKERQERIACERVAALKRLRRRYDTGSVSWGRAPVQGRGPRDTGSVSWEEHCEAWQAYAARFGRSQSAERIAERGGFGFEEIQLYLGRKPGTFEPRTP